MLAMPCSHHARYWSAANNAPGVCVPSQLPSVTHIWILEDCVGQNWFNRDRMVEEIVGISFSGAKSWLVLGYQCMITKSMEEHTIGKIVESQSGVTPSGQLFGVVMTAPILMVESAAFMADEYSLRLLA